MPIRHGNPHSLHNSGFDSVAFYAAHDRYHLCNALTFEWEDEMRVGALHYADLRSFDEKAARLQLAITLTGAHWDREVGEGYAPNWPEALKQTTRRMEADGKWEGWERSRTISSTPTSTCCPGSGTIWRWRGEGDERGRPAARPVPWAIRHMLPSCPGLAAGPGHRGCAGLFAGPGHSEPHGAPA